MAKHTLKGLDMAVELGGRDAGKKDPRAQVEEYQK
jgi:hypothetical protein